MALRPVIKLPESILRRKAHKVTSFEKDFQILIDDMIETMRHEPGVGLAAPQVNVSSQLMVVEYPDNDQNEEAKPKLYVVANPELVEMSSEIEIGLEGCLSVPNLVGEVERSTRVVIKGLNRNGKKQKFIVEGWLARIFQHEVDHLNGILFIDRAIKIWKPEPQEPYEQIISE
jgi:peptide deformylase